VKLPAAIFRNFRAREEERQNLEAKRRREVEEERAVLQQAIEALTCSEWRKRKLLYFLGKDVELLSSIDDPDFSSRIAQTAAEFRALREVFSKSKVALNREYGGRSLLECELDVYIRELDSLDPSKRQEVKEEDSLEVLKPVVKVIEALSCGGKRKARLSCIVLNGENLISRQFNASEIQYESPKIAKIIGELKALSRIVDVSELSLKRKSLVNSQIQEHIKELEQQDKEEKERDGPEVKAQVKKEIEAIHFAEWRKKALVSVLEDDPNLLVPRDDSDSAQLSDPFKLDAVVNEIHVFLRFLDKANLSQDCKNRLRDRLVPFYKEWGLY